MRQNFPMQQTKPRHFLRDYTATLATYYVCDTCGAGENGFGVQVTGESMHALTTQLHALPLAHAAPAQWLVYYREGKPLYLCPACRAQAVAAIEASLAEDMDTVAQAVTA